MSNNLDLEKVRELAKQADTLLNGKEYFVGTIADRLNTTASKYPHDQAIRNMQLMVNDLFKKKGSLATISQREFQDMYDRLSGLGNATRFQEELGDLLYENRKSAVAHYNNDFVGGLRDSGSQLSFGSEEEVSEYQKLWDDKVVVKKAFVNSGKTGLEIELESLGFVNPTVEVAASNDHFVIYAAEVSSKKGRVPFLIPAEIRSGAVLMPSVFVSGDTFADLTSSNISKYVSSFDQRSKLATPTAVLNTLNKVANVDTVPAPSNEPDSFVQVDGPAFFVSHLGMDGVQEPLDIKAPEVPMPKELVGLSESVIKDTLAEAGLSYTKDVVLAAKTMVANEIKCAGLTHDRIVVESEFDGGLTLATNVAGSGGKKRIEVPVCVSDNEQVLMPSAFISGAYAGSFNEEGLCSFASQIDGADFDPFLNDKYDMSFERLHQFAMKKAMLGNFIEATDALTIINEKYGSDCHKLAHDNLMNLLRVGYVEEEKPLTAMEKFIQEAADKVKNKDIAISTSNNPMLFYPQE